MASAVVTLLLAQAGETVTGSRSETLHGGKGANQVSLTRHRGKSHEEKRTGTSTVVQQWWK